MEPENRKNKRTGFIVSLTVHLALLLLFIFLLAWKEPYPPLPEYGIELNLGFDAQGAGDVESEQISEEQNEDPEEEQVEEATEDDTQEEMQPEEVEEISEEIESESFDESESDVSATDASVAEEKVEVQDPEEDKKEEEEKKEEPKVLVTYSSGGNSEGNTEGSGNMGDPEGNEDSDNYEGNLGGGGGAVLDLSGWKWEKPPKPDDRSDARGRIVFQITVDRSGKVTRIKTLEKTVSPLVEKVYREEVLKTKFIKIGSGMAADQSVGKITFVIKSS